ncbi:RNA polymerase sigma24 factor [Elstera cyanobacteriorum]|uniref:RNA polymerase subunit sigma-24 n=1 Tax=Elstera cyanobacteriorum TaxID=2022747 RepID=A0A255XKD3_9PROT|nr:sigma-70 family RNA polymerase sigma factor [Elstera cyanobacteriorum]OYQ17453.1 hypothetical protein CHR90_16005 [Elstera cyanobacteriorum]GFZ94063.1 RNA polymerase sigma24 factor [Elstera cyanobacteriorum]
MSLPAPLIAAAQAGDAAALADLLTRSQPDIRRYAQRYCARSADIDDAMQDALIAVTRRLGQLRQVGAFTGWLVQIVRRACLRALSPLFGFETIEERDELFYHHPTPEGLRYDLARSLAALQPLDRQILVLRDFEQYRLTEVATTVRLSLPAVKSRLHRARAKVRADLLGLDAPSGPA